MNKACLSYIKRLIVRQITRRSIYRLIKIFGDMKALERSIFLWMVTCLIQ